ncbi:Fanconi anemia group J protein homolog [Megachile rotundata]|uniref:Fanconi anemia group J protein homolog n=1 Tax=Megachile rotundata TaxID=143995 RepID=UPI003FD26C99
MLIIGVICAVIGFVVYTGIKLKVNEWLYESRMSKLSLKKYRAKNKRSQFENILPNNVIEITDDESDTADESRKDVESITASSSNQNYDEETLYKFQKSTDSGESDEDEQGSIFESTSNPRAKTSMFDWNYKNSRPNKNTKAVKDDSCSSDESTSFDSKGYHSKQVKKKIKNDHKTNKEPESKKDDPPEVAMQYEQVISGIKVKFPAKPYSCQMAVMNKVIQGCVKSENCLLESPTGTGKTLALLCSVLAWHDHHSAQVQKEQKSNVNPIDDGDFNDCGAGVLYTCEAYDEEYLKKFDEPTKRSKIPKIYYGTRTHKQIQQVTRELRKTAYKQKKMTILSSREHTCIQESNRNKTELCNDLLDPLKGKRCPFYNESNKKSINSFTSLEIRGVNSAWDIEDLVTIGKEEGICPYFAARNLMEFADIIFCPYNYIIDPDIRESMQIDLKDEVVILDEAHNIEDICREVASVAFREDQLVVVATECEALTKQREDDFATYNTIKVYVLKLVKFMKTISLDIVDNITDTSSSPYWTGAELLELFNMHNLGESVYKEFLAACNAAMADVNNMKEESRMHQKNLKPIISPSTQTTLGHLGFSMRMITTPQYVNDYRACVIENTVKDFKFLAEDTWQTFKKQEHRARTLKLICMNPGVIFEPLSRSVRCIILASGTLTPTASYQSELNTTFSHILNAGHVIPKEQVYATCISKGPNGIQLRANYQTVNSWGFQDELGLVLLRICESIPHGVLCFFSSYNVMYKQTERWKHTSTWNEISRIKRVFVEPRHGSELEFIMNEYREVIETTSAGPIGKINGGLFLAVYRGKVAEGIDFKDNEARCVVCVGIPFPVRKDPVIDMKFKYNDANTAKGLLRGTEWYSIQAFRALNQALGRCLRHINDWGAVILVDERFLLPEYKANLPKWVKTMWVNQKNCNFMDELRDFVKRRKGELS